MSKLWEVGCKIDELASRIQNVAHVVEFVAEKTIEEPTSGALWSVRDTLCDLVEKIEIEVHRLMEINRELAAPNKKK
jgi:hypothetical protein